jgi:hypothetical protein
MHIYRFFSNYFDRKKILDVKYIFSTNFVGIIFLSGNVTEFHDRRLLYCYEFKRNLNGSRIFCSALLSVMNIHTAVFELLCAYGWQAKCDVPNKIAYAAQGCGLV